jgi:disulfide bond formation protein DsbB
MSVDAVTTFLALLAVLALAFVVVSAVGALVGRVRGGLPPVLAAARDAIAPVALPLAFAVALTCTVGSLYLSEIANFPPCILCWYQRICMYPLVVLLGVASLRKDRGVRWYAGPLATIGAGFSVYHYLVERFEVESFACTTEVPCSTVWVWKFHFLSIPAMAGIGFLAVIALLLMARPGGDDPGVRHDEPRTEEVPA